MIFASAAKPLFSYFSPLCFWDKFRPGDSRNFAIFFAHFLLRICGISRSFFNARSMRPPPSLFFAPPAFWAALLKFAMEGEWRRLCSRARKLRSLKRAARERFAAGGDAPKRGGCGSAYRAMRTLCGVFAICPNSGSQCYCGLVGGRQGKIRVGKRGCLRGSYALVYGGEILRRFCGVFSPRGSRGCAAPQSA